MRWKFFRFLISEEKSSSKMPLERLEDATTDDASQLPHKATN